MRSTARRARRHAARCAVPLALGVVLGCAGSKPTADPTDAATASRVPEALADDPAVAARREEHRAALERERAPAVLEEVELRVRGDETDDERLELTARVPLRHPAEVSAERAARRAETQAALSRLEETVLDRRAERCFHSVDAAAHAARVAAYATWETRQQRLLRWNTEWRQSGSANELLARRFELDARIRLLTRRPGPPPPASNVEPWLPALDPPLGPLVAAPELVVERVRERHPSVAVHRAIAERYRALAERARARGRPWLDFVDLSYEALTRRRDDREIGAQVAFRVPFGPESDAQEGRYRALERGQEREADVRVLEQARAGLIALWQLDTFERRGPEWQELLELADEAEETADRWWEARLTRPSSLANLLDRAWDAREAVLEARIESGYAGCTLLGMTGVPLDDWPREAAARPDSDGELIP